MLIAILNYLRPKKSPPPENLDVGRGQSIPRSPFSGTNWARIGQGWPKKPNGESPDVQSGQKNSNGGPKKFPFCHWGEQPSNLKRRKVVNW